MATGSYFARRWNGQVPLGTLVWQDMLGVGTLINLTASFVAFLALIQGVPAVIALALHLAPTPFNLFLLAAVWRAPGRNGLAVAVAVLWFGAMAIL